MRRRESVLNRETIRRLIVEKGLVSGYIDLDTQLTPNGFDLTIEKVFAFGSRGRLDFSNKERLAAEEKELAPRKKKVKDAFGWWELKKGIYKVRTNEAVKLPRDMIALAFSRSSLLRSGAFTHTAVWDAGFAGKSEFVLAVENAFGIAIKENARVAQLVFMRMDKTCRGYAGIYQGR